MQSALLTNFKVLLVLLFRDIVHQISKLIFYVTHISASFPTDLPRSVLPDLSRKIEGPLLAGYYEKYMVIQFSF